MATSSFAKKLLDWAGTYDRNLPWKSRTDAYAIWLSEIILQQTRMEQGLPYYVRFLEAFPTIQDLAQADEQKVMKLWQGLGYYSRARNLHFTAQYITKELNGQFPKTYETLLALKGVGPYTAAAIASFAYGLPHAVVDGNVFRVLARYAADFTDIGTGAGRKHFTELANQLLDIKQPGAFNQALMDLGAMICKPQNPACNQCPLEGECRALAQNRIAQLPVKAKKIKRKTRYFYYFVFRKGETLWIQKRTGKDIWQSLYEFPNIESPKHLTKSKIQEGLQEIIGANPSIKNQYGPITQLLTHQKIIAYFWEVDVLRKPRLDSLIAVQEGHLPDYPFPKMMAEYIRNQ